MANKTHITNKRRIHTTTLNFPIAGIIGLMGTLIRSLFALPIPDIESWAQAASQPIYVIAQIIILIGLIKFTFPNHI